MWLNYGESTSHPQMKKGRGQIKYYCYGIKRAPHPKYKANFKAATTAIDSRVSTTIYATAKGHTEGSEQPRGTQRAVNSQEATYTSEKYTLWSE